jgi:glycosyltransferase involved in cell wall biosynthesis
MSYHSNKRPYLTIIIATLNVEQTLEKCLDSIIHQTSINKIEIIIKDGRSNDKTIDIIKKYDRYIRYWETSSDSGVYDAWNKVLPIASGEWVLFLGGDDTLFDISTISNSFSILNTTDNTIDLAYGRVRLVSKEYEKILDLGKDWDRTKKCIKEKMCIPHQGIFHKKSLFERYGNFSIDYDISSDYDFTRRVILEKNVHYLDIIVSCMQVGGISSNTHNTFIRLKEIRQINKNYGSRVPGILWLITFTNACFRYSLFLLIGEKSGKQILDRFRMVAGLPPYWTKI